MQKCFLPAVAVLIAALSVWFLSRQAPVAPQPVGVTRSAPDSFMENFTTRVLDARGRLRYELRAVYMAHYAYDDRSEFNTPRFEAHRPDGQRWSLAAESGTAQHGSRQILLHDEVLIQRWPQPAQGVDLEIRTRDVLVRPDDAYAETDHHLVATRGTSVLEANGMQAYFREDRVQLLSQVKGVYEAPRD
jgi:lipopolysaccharide export system protein LptC